MSVLCLVGIADVHAASPFGAPGRHGRDGVDGRSGDPGRNIELFVSARDHLSYDLGGDSALDGTDGYPGENGTDCRQDLIASDLIGASGGAGGNAGLGGNGGAGGNAVLHTDDLSKLKRIVIYAPGGRGARSGRSAYGGHPCTCRVSRWIAHGCRTVYNPQTGQNQQTCGDFPFSCQAGQEGLDGKPTPTAFGANGKAGRLTIIPSLAKIEADVSHAEFDLAAPARPVAVLSSSVWENRNGANGLLGEGSQVDDEYRLLTSQQTIRTEFRWNSSRPISDFRSLEGEISLNEKRTGTEFGFRSGLWYEAKAETTGTTSSGGMKTLTQLITINEAVTRGEALNLAFGEISGTGRNLKVTIKDQGHVSDRVHTSFEVRIRHSGFLDTKVIYEGAVPADNVTRTGSEFTLRLGEISGMKMSELESGRRIKVIVTTKRSLGEFSELDEERSDSYDIP
ncbi:MAG: hypothetical protein H7222_10050 [Methylotenera sp.]|nr:hypothetical protein [Oligoflexia bacterium]